MGSNGALTLSPLYCSDPMIMRLRSRTAKDSAKREMMLMVSYPVPPEVGKVGTNSPTFIQPVSERADGIKSFFQKQTGTSPAKKSIIPKSEIKDDKAGTTRGVKRERSADTKSDIKEEGQDRKRRRSSSSIIEGTREGEEEEIKTVIKDEEGKEDPEPGLGVDSNAPAPKDEKGNEKDKEETPKRKRGGHEIKVTRKPEEVKSDVSTAGKDATSTTVIQIYCDTSV